MATTRQRVDKDTFKQIFRDHWGPFQQHQPRYQDRHVQAVIDKMGVSHLLHEALLGIRSVLFLTES